MKAWCRMTDHNIELSPELFDALCALSDVSGKTASQLLDEACQRLIEEETHSAETLETSQLLNSNYSHKEVAS